MSKRNIRGIRKAIKKAGGISELAQKLGISRQAVHYWQENGLLSITRLKQISEATDIPLNEIIE